MKLNVISKLCLLIAATSFAVADTEHVEITADGSIQEGGAADETVVEETPVAEIPAAEKPVIDPKCPDRDHIIRCAGAYLDTNKNNKLDRSELQAAIDSLPWYAQGVLKILGSVDKMMKKCDVDKDDAISINYDMSHNKEECLATCFKRRAFKSSFFPDCDL